MTSPATSQTYRPFTSPCRTWPTQAAARTRRLKKSN
ncbi:hypothetical protein [Rhodopirellula baltica]